MASDGFWYPPEDSPTTLRSIGAVGSPLVTIGDITVYADYIVTPGGTMSHRGLQWTARDASTTEESMPAYAIVLAILLFFACFLGLLFLLIKEKKTTGYVEVSVQSPEGYHLTQIPISSPSEVHEIRARVDYARAVSMAYR